MLLEADCVSRRYGEEYILKDVSLAIRPGDMVSIVGPSGCGKTTLLSLLSLLLDPTDGKVRVQGRDAKSFPDAERSRLRNEFFGCVFQAAHLVGSLSVLDNVLVPAFLSGRAREKRKAAGELLEQLGLSARASHLPHMLSLGQKRRVALARALLMRPAVILADEPTNDLDPRRADQVADFLLGLPSEGYALVLVTHDQQLAARARKRWFIREGQLHSDSDPHLYLRKPTVLKRNPEAPEHHGWAHLQAHGSENV